MNGACSTARGMTLIEVMFALAILLVLSAGVGAFFLQMTSQRDQLLRMASQQRDVALVFDRMESALLSAVAVTPDGSAGVTGDELSLKVATRGVQPAFDDGAALADLSAVSFGFDEAAATCTLTVESAAGSLAEPVAGLIERVRFRYSDGRRWRASFDSLTAGGLPVAVEVSVWVEPRFPREESAPATPATSAWDAGDPSGDPDGERGPMDLPPPEPAAPAWIPREPDFVRVIGVPDAPDWQERES